MSNLTVTCWCLFASGVQVRGFFGDAWFEYGSEGHLCGDSFRSRSSSTTAVVCSVLFLLVSTHFAPCSLLLFSGPDARHHGRHEPEGQFCGQTEGLSAVADHHRSLISLSWCRGRFPWSWRSADHRISPVAPVHGGRCPCCVVVQVVDFPFVPQRQLFMTVEIPQLQYVAW